MKPTAIILAAGRGLRMGPRGELTPKGLIQLGGQALVEASVLALADRGIGRIRIVTGHLAEAYEAAAATWKVPVELVFNPAFAETGSLNSLVAGLNGVEGPCVVLESDVTYEPRALAPVSTERSVLVLSGPTGAGDEVYVWADPADRRLQAMSKQRAERSDPHYGELVGVLGLTAADTARLRQVGVDMVAATPRSDYEPGVVAMARDVPVWCHKIDDLAWTEIDDEAMLRHAEQTVFPRIVAARSRLSA